jgi:hypothetical protein
MIGFTFGGLQQNVGCLTAVAALQKMNTGGVRETQVL